MSVPDIAHETHGAESAVEYAYAAINVRNCSVGENMEVIPNTFKQAMTLPAKAQWKAASDKEVASLKTNNVYTLLPMTAVPTGHKIIGSRWVYKVTTHPRDALLYLGSGNCLAWIAAACLPLCAGSRASAWYWR